MVNVAQKGLKTQLKGIVGFDVECNYASLLKSLDTRSQRTSISFARSAVIADTPSRNSAKATPGASASKYNIILSFHVAVFVELKENVYI